MAISTTGDEHRMGFLETCVKAWLAALPPRAALFVTVDGSAEDARRVAGVVDEWTGSVFRVGQHCSTCAADPASPRQGVAVNKNTGLELLRDASVKHLFLSDDDTWPLFAASLDKHTQAQSLHSMVMWGKSRLTSVDGSRGLATWTWPRGAVMYARHTVVECVGGMDERFGPGGHEHAEWSQRIRNAGLTPAPFVSPASYATRGAMGARVLWHAEDMPRPGELGGTWMSRKRHNTTIHHKPGDRTQIDKIMAEREGSSDFVPYRAHENGRASATLCTNLTCAVEPAEPRSQE